MDRLASFLSVEVGWGWIRFSQEGWFIAAAGTRPSKNRLEGPGVLISVNQPAVQH